MYGPSETKRLITAEMVEAEAAAGCQSILAPRGEAIITPAAWSRARSLGVTFDEAMASAVERARPNRAAITAGPVGLSGSAVSSTASVAAGEGSCERIVDESGLVLVRGKSVRLGAFAAAGAGRDVRLTDVVTGADRSPMTAGIMSWHRSDSFPWTLGYDEIDLVLDGVVQIGIGGRVLEGKPGDVFYIPKGSSIVFGTPSRARVFYVTYPADWAAAPAAGQSTA